MLALLALDELKSPGGQLVTSLFVDKACHPRGPGRSHICAAYIVSVMQAVIRSVAVPIWATFVGWLKL
jgi:hypothetical protein